MALVEVDKPGRIGLRRLDERPLVVIVCDGHHSLSIRVTGGRGRKLRGAGEARSCTMRASDTEVPHVCTIGAHPRTSRVRQLAAAARVADKTQRGRDAIGMAVVLPGLPVYFVRRSGTRGS